MLNPQENKSFLIARDAAETGVHRILAVVPVIGDVGGKNSPLDPCRSGDDISRDLI
jgi:hypothetical protein